jgi:1-acyl-sn-glycerol-3-phosphate acyltransferase
MKPEPGREPANSSRTASKRFCVRLLPRLILAAIVIAVLTPILAFPMILAGLFPGSAGATYRMARCWCLALYRAMGLTFSIEGAEKIIPGASYIIAPNHQGNADILALIVTLPLRFRWVIKKELLRIPVFGWALGRTGAVPLDRSDPAKAVKALKGASSKLKGGWSILIYPEGTRGSDPNLQRFKKGAFMLAVQTGIPILPVTCNGAFHILPRKTILFIPGHIKVCVGNPISTDELTEKDAPELMQKTREEILKNLDPDYNPFSEKWSRLSYPRAIAEAGAGHSL